MIGFLVRGRIRIKIRIRIRVGVGVTFNISVYHWSNCRRSKCTFKIPPKKICLEQNSPDYLGNLVLGKLNVLM